MKAKIHLCHECDLVHKNTDLVHGSSAHCSRCGALLYQKQGSEFSVPLAFSIAGFMFFVLANMFPILSFSMRGNTKQNQLIDGVLIFLQTDYWMLGALVLLLSVIAPVLILCFLISLLLPLQFGFRPRFFEWQLKCLIFLRPWAMAEILLVGVMVAYVKLGDFAVVHIGLSLLSIIAMVICTLLAFATLDFQALWRRAPFAQQEAGYV
ncbi:paraquat-inducible protein A [Sneathiella glossodoripedis]|uniref:paraquat-inducible protein A n=1 Tax=Sneathiella glossodoripedis TaxID=418853 RepID=UPI0011DE17AA|nr:paraquat-inducible protein A [Sneathiella glossodoripedis]